jgi:hypothetical protein
LIDITICSLDDPDLLAPEDHIHVSSKLNWMHLCDDLPQHPESRPDEGFDAL